MGHPPPCPHKRNCACVAGKRDRCLGYNAPVKKLPLSARDQNQIRALQPALKKNKRGFGANEHFQLEVQKSQARSKKAKSKKESAAGIGEFFLLVDITAREEDIYIPLSIASGKKSTGFVYQIEGTAEGTIFTTKLSVRGDGVTQITWGTLLYAKIPKNKTGTFRILITTRGKRGKTYKVVITRVNYKLSLRERRYKRFEAEIVSESTKFRYR